MRTTFKSLVLVFAVASSSISNAQGSWYAEVQGPDVFGDVTALAYAEAALSADSLVVQCGKESLAIAYTMPATPKQVQNFSESEISIPATLLIKADDGDVKRLDSSLRLWNDTSIAVAADGRRFGIVKALEEIKNAQSRISVGITVSSSDGRQSGMFPVSGSTRAMGRIYEACELGKISAQD